MVRCYCLPGNPDKLGQHVVGHCPAAESDYVVAQAGLQQDASLIPIPYRLDLTPIEHMWDELDRRVRKRRNPPATLAQLRNALIDEWNNIPMRTVIALVNSIQRRIRAATAARGGHTRY